jgi:hypothetical protein
METKIISKNSDNKLNDDKSIEEITGEKNEISNNGNHQEPLIYDKEVTFKDLVRMKIF